MDHVGTLSGFGIFPDVVSYYKRELPLINNRALPLTTINIYDLAAESILHMWPLQTSAVKPVLRDHCLKRPPVLKNHICLAKARGPKFPSN